MASNDSVRKPNVETLVQIADARCVQAGVFAVKVPGESPEEKTDHLLGLFADAALERLGRLGKRQVKELRAFLTEDIEAPYSVTNEGPTKTVGTPSSRYVLARRAATTRPGKALRTVVSVDMPWDGEGRLRYRAEMTVNWTSSGREPAKDEDGSATVVRTRGYVWDTGSAVPPEQRLFLETPMHGLYDRLREEGEVVAVKGLADKRFEDLRDKNVARLGGVETALASLPDTERRTMLGAALAALDGGEGADEALGAIWREVMTSAPSTQWWPSMVAAELQVCREAHLEKRASGLDDAEDEGRHGGSKRGLEKELERARKEAEDAKARLAKAQEANATAETRMREQLKEARAEAAELRRQVDGARTAAEEAESARAAAKEAQEAAETRERAAEEALKELDRTVSDRDNEVRRLDAQIESLSEAARDTALASWGETSMPVSEMFSVPRSLDEVLELAEQAWPKRLMVLPSAHKAAKAWSGRDLDRPWRALCAVAEVLWSLHFVERVPNEQEALAELTGFTLIPSESKTVSENKMFREARTFLWDGERVYMPAHISVANGSSEVSVRLHFAYDEDGKRVVIGHLGKHLPNTLS